MTMLTNSPVGPGAVAAAADFATLGLRVFVAFARVAVLVVLDLDVFAMMASLLVVVLDTRCIVGIIQHRKAIGTPADT